MRTTLGLTDVLVAIGCVVFLFFVSLPVCGLGRNHAKQVVCMTNVRGLARAWVMYADDNDGMLVGANQGTTEWVDRPHYTDLGYPTYTNHNSTVAEKINGIEGGLLFPYTGQPSMYHCPGDERYLTPVSSRGRGGYRSYSVSGAMNGHEYVDLDGQRYYHCERYSDIVEPSRKYVFVEENYTHSPATPATLPMNMGYSGGVWSMWRNNYIDSWWDPLAVWHDDGAVLGYADGHAEYRQWADQRTVWFAQDRLDPRLGSSIAECAHQPNNPDQQYMTAHSAYHTR